MSYFLENNLVNNIFLNAEKELFNSERIKFKKCTFWRKENVPNIAGIYAIFDETNKLIYIGESGNLNPRMNEINRTVNHSFRKQLGFKMFNGIKSRKKFEDSVEQSLDDYFEKKLYVSFLPVNFGRLEIETFLVTKHQASILNSKKKRK